MICDIFQAEPAAPEAQIHLHVDDNTQETLTETKPTKDSSDDEVDELNKSLQDLIIEYRLQEQQKNAAVNQENDQEEEEDDDDVNLQRILKQIGVSIHNKYHQKRPLDQSSTKLSETIQQLYQMLKKTQPQLFTKTFVNPPGANTNTDDGNEEVENEIVEEEQMEDELEEPTVPLTPEMEHANTIYNQAMKLINGTANRQYDT